MSDPKVFDVSPPVTDATVAPAARPVHKMMVNEPTLEPSKSLTPGMDEPGQAANQTTVSRKAPKITPLTDEETSEPENDPETTTTTEDEPEDEEEIELQPTPAAQEPAKKADQLSGLEVAEPVDEKTEPIKDFGAVDSILPDDSQRATATAKESMQSPTMYDTKAYYVPIGNSQHKHGHIVGALIAGLVTAGVVGFVVLYGSKFL